MSVYGNFKVVLDNPNSTWTLLTNLVKSNSKVLDIGCSSGYFAEVLIKQKKCVVDGVEIDKKDAKLAKQVCRKVFEVNIEEIHIEDYFDESYDYIVFADVLEHLVNPAETITKVARLLKPNGKILFSIPNMAHGLTRLQLLQGSFDYEDEGLLDRTHLHFYTRNTVNEMVENSGLKLLQLDATTFDIPNHLIRQVLSAVGLSSSSSFEKFITSGDSLIYQFIGVVGAKGRTDETTNDKTKAIKPRLSYNKEINDLKKEAESLFIRLQSTEINYNKLQEKNNLLKNEIDELKKQILMVQRIPGVKFILKRNKTHTQR